jgi:hypothetical protein
MMNCYVYLWVDGRDFDPDAFNKSMDPSLKGNIENRKRAENDFTKKYWKSKEIQVEPKDNAEDCLYNLLVSYKSALLSLDSIENKRIFAEIVVRYSDLDSIRGFYFPQKLLCLLAKVGAELDIDVYGPL